MTVSLILADGTCFKGESFGYEHPVSGELVFNTAMAGYPELLTEPASRGQLIVMTYPVIGNYGIQPIARSRHRHDGSRHAEIRDSAGGTVDDVQCGAAQ